MDVHVLTFQVQSQEPIIKQFYTEHIHTYIHCLFYLLIFLCKRRTIKKSMRCTLLWSFRREKTTQCSTCSKYLSLKCDFLNVNSQSPFFELSNIPLKFFFRFTISQRFVFLFENSNENWPKLQRWTNTFSKLISKPLSKLSKQIMQVYLITCVVICLK